MGASLREDTAERSQTANALPSFLLLYGALYSAYGTESAYMPAFLQSHGLAFEQIGLVLAAGTIIRIVAGPATGRLADHLGTHRLVVGTAAGLSECAGCGCAFSQCRRPSIDTDGDNNLVAHAGRHPGAAWPDVRPDAPRGHRHHRASSTGSTVGDRADCLRHRRTGHYLGSPDGRVGLSLRLVRYPCFLGHGGSLRHGPPLGARPCRAGNGRLTVKVAPRVLNGAYCQKGLDSR
jgi:MFS_1 like family